jgi:pimeloyl-ACP methyl ester carboxylesterase
MHFVDTGTGTPLVLLHAYPVDSRMWDPVRGSLPEGVRLITPDQRGMGRSPMPSDDTDPSMDVAADDVLAMMDELGLDRAVIGGVSMGGYTAMALLRRARERVAGLVLMNTRPDADDPDRRQTRLAAAERAEREGVSWLPDTMLPMLLAAGTPTVRPELVGWLRAMILDQSPAGVAWAQRAMAARPDSTDVLRGYTGPALVVAGERDVVSTPELAAQMAELMPAGELVELAGCGHLSPVEAPAELAAAIGQWLARTGLTPA